MRAGNDGTHVLQVRLEQARRYRRHVLTDTARFLGLTAPQDAVAADLPFATNITTSRHNLIAPFP
jgi:hypothetical protein